MANFLEETRYLSNPEIAKRAPTFVVANGKVICTMGGRVQILNNGPISFRRHGSFELLYNGFNFALIQHITPFDADLPVLIGRQARVSVTRGYIRCSHIDSSEYLALLDKYPVSKAA